MPPAGIESAGSAIRHLERARSRRTIAKMIVAALLVGTAARGISRSRRARRQRALAPKATPTLAPPPTPGTLAAAPQPAPRARVTTYPNRDKPQSRATRVIVIAILIVSVALVLAVTIGGWSELEGMKAVNFAWCAAYLGIAHYVSRWSRGLLPIAAALAVLLGAIALIAGTGLFGTSWFDRAHEGFAASRSLFGGGGLDADTLGVLTLAIVPVQVLLMGFAMHGFGQGWNVEVEAPAP